MAKVLFKRKTSNEIKELEVEDGALIFNIENGKTYMDYGEKRIPTGGNADTIISIGEEEPTDEDVKIWIDPEKLVKTPASNVVNSMEGDEIDKSPSVQAVKKYIDWKLVGETSSDQELNLPSAFNELLIYTGYSVNNYWDACVVTIPKIILTSDYQDINVGGHYTLANTGLGAVCRASLTKFKLKYLYVNQADSTGKAVTKVYYR